MLQRRAALELRGIIMCSVHTFISNLVLTPVFLLFVAQRLTYGAAADLTRCARGEPRVPKDSPVGGGVLQCSELEWRINKRQIAVFAGEAVL